MNYVPELGKLAPEDAKRDCIHVAVAPVVAGETLSPGSRVELRDGKAFEVVCGGVGIVDPFLIQGPGEGERFWLCLMPGTVTSLRHVWGHPAFTAKVPGKETP